MRGEFLGVWSETWREIWQPLIDHPPGDDDEGVPEDVFCELYRALAPALSPQPSVEAVADIIDNPIQSREAFEGTTAAAFAGERELLGFLESAHEALEDLGGDELSNRYFNLLERFIDKFSLRYDLRRPCVLCPTLPGVVTSLVQHLKVASLADAHLAKLHHEYAEAVRDLRMGRTEARIKSCLTRLYILIEGLANSCGGTSSDTLGDRCNQASWPHKTLKAAAGNLYGFRSNYPGLGHSGNPASVLRDVDDRDLVGVSCMLLGVVPYVDSTVSIGGLFGERLAPVAPRVGPSGQLSPGRSNVPLLGRIRSRLKTLLGWS